MNKDSFCIISPSFFPATYYGGPMISAYQFAKFLSKRILVNVSTTNANGSKRLNIKTNRWLKESDNFYIKYYGAALKNGFSPFMLLCLWNDIRNAQIIYLVSVFSPTTPITFFYNIFFNKPLIISPRGQLGEWCLKQGSSFKKLWLKLFIKPLVKKIAFHATSNQETEMIKSIYPDANVWIIPNGLDISPFKAADFKKDKSFFKKYYDKIEAETKVIISMGRLQKVKGFDILIEAVENIQHCILFIAGSDFGELTNLQNLIHNKNLSHKIFLIGNLEGDEKINFLKNADLFALPSHHENFGMVYAEALASGTPVIASKHTPWYDVEKFNCGKWVDNTPELFAKAIKEILDEDLIQLGKNGTKYIDENYSWHKIAAEFIKNFILLRNRI